MSQMALAGFRSDPRLQYIGGKVIPGNPTAARRVLKLSRRKGKACKVCKRPPVKPGSAWSDPYEAWKTGAVIVFGRWARQLELRRPMWEHIVAEYVFVHHRPLAAPSMTIDGETRPYPFEWTPNRNLRFAIPDFDNLAKGPGDAAKAAGFIRDDCLIQLASVAKFYAADGEDPHTEVRLWKYAL